MAYPYSTPRRLYAGRDEPSSKLPWIAAGVVAAGGLGWLIYKSASTPPLGPKGDKPWTAAIRGVLDNYLVDMSAEDFYGLPATVGDAAFQMIRETAYSPSSVQGKAGAEKGWASIGQIIDQLGSAGVVHVRALYKTRPVAEPTVQFVITKAGVGVDEVSSDPKGMWIVLR